MLSDSRVQTAFCVVKLGCRVLVFVINKLLVFDVYLCVRKTFECVYMYLGKKTM
jgi:hypothetical protein